jgi:hypothetical protein
LLFSSNIRGGAFAEWDYLRGQKEGWIPKIPSPTTSSVDIHGTCYDIIFRTSDDASIVHEFPDPKSLDLANWQGFSINDDVVTSHGEVLEMDMGGKWYNPTTSGNSSHFSMIHGITLLTVAIGMIGFTRLVKKNYLERNGYRVIEENAQNKL